MESENKVDEALEKIIQYCQTEWKIFTKDHFERQYGLSTNAGYQG